MPELPEVETIRRQLARRVLRTTLERVEVFETRLRRRVPARRLHGLEGRMLAALERYGKYLLFHFAPDGPTLFFHLGMTGRLLCDGTPPPHTHLRLRFSRSVVLYADARRFGILGLSSRRFPEELSRLGPDALSETFSPSYLAARSRGRKRAIHSLLLDQREVAGIGNIYASEILHVAGIRPYRPAGSLEPRHFRHLVGATRAVLREAIRHRGTSISDYRDVAGRPGRYQHRLRVYGRASMPCPACGEPLRSSRIAGRTSFFCERCQV
ncbi:MAG: formamidopyrimidine-DNA glycosylase [Candidatus Binatia bacterium]|nr:MAG: formamidopyrimidine-DNA glycosylase [Candidatus Binatia bacterium]